MAKLTGAQKIIKGQQILQAFWGQGALGSAEDAEVELKVLELTKKQYQQLRDELPYARGAGTTGQRVGTADNMLERLAR